MDELFTDNGKYHLLRESKCRFAYLDSPQVFMTGGRVRIKTRLITRLAIEVDGQCSGTEDTLAVTASARPTFAGETIGLTDVRIEQISREEYRVLLQAFAERVLPQVLQINLREGLQRILSDAGTSYEVTVGQLTVIELTAENNRLAVRLWFALSAR